jgi:hypothetical protein
MGVLMNIVNFRICVFFFFEEKIWWRTECSFGEYPIYRKYVYIIDIIDLFGNQSGTGPLWYDQLTSRIQ